MRPQCDAISQHRSGSTFVQVMACCLITAPSHYLDQWWLITKGVLWYWRKAVSHEQNLCHVFGDCTFIGDYNFFSIPQLPYHYLTRIFVFCRTHQNDSYHYTSFIDINIRFNFLMPHSFGKWICPYRHTAKYHSGQSALFIGLFINYTKRRA